MLCILKFIYEQVLYLLDIRAISAILGEIIYIRKNFMFNSYEFLTFSARVPTLRIFLLFLNMEYKNNYE